jgi:hypothetical protein
MNIKNVSGNTFLKSRKMKRTENRKKVIQTKVHIHDMQKNITIAVLIVMLLMFALSPVFILSKRGGNVPSGSAKSVVGGGKQLGVGNVGVGNVGVGNVGSILGGNNIGNQTNSNNSGLMYSGSSFNSGINGVFNPISNSNNVINNPISMQPQLRPQQLVLSQDSQYSQYY